MSNVDPKPERLACGCVIEESKPGRRYETVTEAARYVKCTEQTIRRMIAAGKLTGYRSGTRLVRVDLDELDALLAGGGQ